MSSTNVNLYYNQSTVNYAVKIRVLHAYVCTHMLLQREKRGRERERKEEGEGSVMIFLQFFSSVVAVQYHFRRSLLQRGCVCSLSL